MITFLLLALLQVKVPDPSQFVGPPKGAPVAGAALEQRTYEIASLLRCPVCQGMSVADSPSTVAQDMKAQVHDLLARGYTQEQILGYFEHSYGQFVLLKPKFRGVNTLVWILPIFVLVVGAVVVIGTARRLEKEPAEQPEAQAAASDDPYLARVRELMEKQ
ncbi:MAG TPA: cytochrome c-type biogenesis protein CcmH [Thermoanaerobaculia bacterium]|jgi:cytochrome c-type biogenesis protein CcmH|nr:cytochrome c-type biogenesis protein CcmH [Thermoanaerobaculia bacterium]